MINVAAGVGAALALDDVTVTTAVTVVSRVVGFGIMVGVEDEAIGSGIDVVPGGVPTVCDLGG